MGAKQSKRSVDISGKETECAGEVVAAAGEGRMELLADADTLKPQLNGDAPHIQTPEEKTEKEKQLDNGTPENEKDATTEKEEKAREAKEGSPVTVTVTNGETEHKEEGEGVEAEVAPAPAPAPEQDSAKKPKKEKVKKKWSLRSFSFNRKDKPKQEKKSKDEEPKANGEPEKVPEEGAEPNAQVAESDAELEKVTENKDEKEKTPDTPVTEPLTNGSNTSETPNIETPASEESVVLSSIVKVPEEAKVEPQPEQLPVNGLSLEEEKKDLPEAKTKVESQDNKSQEETAVPTETAPVPEIPVKSEVCVEKSPLIESIPPPLPANPPPSSVASFAVTTMAPHLTDTALLDNTTNSELTVSTTPPVTTEASDNTPLASADHETSNKSNDNIALNNVDDQPIESAHVPLVDNVVLSEKSVEEVITVEPTGESPLVIASTKTCEEQTSQPDNMEQLKSNNIAVMEQKEVDVEDAKINIVMANEVEAIDVESSITNNLEAIEKKIDEAVTKTNDNIEDLAVTEQDGTNMEDKAHNKIEKCEPENSDKDEVTTGTLTEQVNQQELKPTKELTDVRTNGLGEVEDSGAGLDTDKISLGVCNGGSANGDCEGGESGAEWLPPPAPEDGSGDERSDTFPPPPQDPIPVAAKIMDIVVPEVADIASSDSVTEPSTEVAVTN